MAVLTAVHKQRIQERRQEADGAGVPADLQAFVDWYNQDIRIAEPESNRPTISQPPTDLELLDAIDQNTAAKLADLPNFHEIMELIHQKPPQAGAVILFLMKAGKIDPINAGALRDLLGRTVPDPNWQPKVEVTNRWQQDFDLERFEFPDGYAVQGQADSRVLQEAFA
jgi:hypothetical protein